MLECQAALPEAEMHKLKWQLQMFTGSYCRLTKGLLPWAECYETHVIDADTQ